MQDRAKDVNDTREALSRIERIGRVGWYLATPYSGIENKDEAYRDAAVAIGGLVSVGIMAYSPILHWHPIAKLNPNLPTDAEFWRYQNEHTLRNSTGLIVYQMPGYISSKGVSSEIEFMYSLRKPIVYLPYHAGGSTIPQENVSAENLSREDGVEG